MRKTTLLLGIVLAAAVASAQSGSGILGSGGYLIFPEASGAPSGSWAGHACLYAKDKAGTTELFYRNSAGVERDLSAAGGGGGSPCDAWPLGAVFVSTTSTNPGTSLGCGTWSAFGAGRVLVGFDAGQTEFDTDEETGGAKTHTLTTAEMPAHTHVQDAHTHVQNSHNHTQDAHTHTLPVGATDDTAAPFDRADAGANTGGANASTSVGSTTATNQAATAVNQNATATNQSAGGGGAHNNLQPYITVRFWKRTQ